MGFVALEPLGSPLAATEVLEILRSNWTTECTIYNENYIGFSVLPSRFLALSVGDVPVNGLPPRCAH